MEYNLKEKIKIISRQTDLSNDEIIQQLSLYNDNHIDVIRNFFGINTNMLKQKEEEVQSINQTIYKQIRKRLDSSMQLYREGNDNTYLSKP